MIALGLVITSLLSDSQNTEFNKKRKNYPVKPESEIRTYNKRNDLKVNFLKFKGKYHFHGFLKGISYMVENDLLSELVTLFNCSKAQLCPRNF